MTAHQPDQIRAMQQFAASEGLADSEAQLRGELEALLALSNELAVAAGLAEESFERVFGTIAVALSGKAPARSGDLIPFVKDIREMLAPGMRALDTLASRGESCRVPALALWRELHGARVALIDMAARLARANECDTRHG